MPSACATMWVALLLVCSFSVCAFDPSSDRASREHGLTDQFEELDGLAQANEVSAPQQEEVEKPNQRKSTPGEKKDEGNVEGRSTVPQAGMNSRGMPMMPMGGGTPLNPQMLAQMLNGMITGQNHASGMLYNTIIFSMYGSVAAAVLSIGWSLLAMIRARTFSSVTIDMYSPAYNWVKLWLSDHIDELPLASSTEVKLVLRESLVSRNGRNHRAYQISPQHEGEINIQYLPQQNQSFRIVFNGRWLWIFNSHTEQSLGRGEGTVSKESINLSCLGSSRELISDFVKECRAAYQSNMKSMTQIWTAGGGGGGMFGGGAGGWTQLDARPSRPLDTVILPNNVGHEIIADMQEFLDNEKWYYSRGIPYRRGYLLFGPPGCGKTSFITAAAGELQMTICMLSMTSSSITDERLLSLMSSAPKHSIILIEDIDAVFDSDEDANDPKRSQSPARGSTATAPFGQGSIGPFSGSGAAVAANTSARRSKVGCTFSGLLNAIDGVAAQEGKILFLTTNHVDKLDEALIRVDVRAKFGLSTIESASRLFQRFYRDSELDDDIDLDEMAETFGSKIEEDVFSLASIQGHLMRFRSDPNKALETVYELYEAKKLARKAAQEAAARRSEVIVEDTNDKLNVPSETRRGNHKTEEAIPSHKLMLSDEMSVPLQLDKEEPFALRRSSENAAGAMLMMSGELRRSQI